MKINLSTQHNPTIHSLQGLGLSANKLDRQAVSVTDRLVKAGFQAYLVGGCVRDLLLGMHPKDFDVSTNAEPEQIQALFKNCRLIGRRFRLAHIYFGRSVIEVATFRGPHLNQTDKSRAHQDGRLLRDNVYGTLEEDAWRRDFTVNALYLDTQKKTVIDYVGGIKDHQNRVLRMMGEPTTRYKEDPVRLLRAARFKAKLNFTFDAKTEAPIQKLSPLLKDISAARLYDEVLKLFLNTNAKQVFNTLRQYGLFSILFPQTGICLKNAISSEQPLALINQAMENTESRLKNNQHITPYFLLATLLWEPVRQLTARNRSSFNSDTQAIHAAANEVIAHQIGQIAIPRRITTPMREVWALQPRFHKRTGVRCLRFLEHPRFRAAYDFMLLRSQYGEVDAEIADWWTHIQTLESGEQKRLILPKQYKHRKKPQRKPSLQKPLPN